MTTTNNKEKDPWQSGLIKLLWFFDDTSGQKVRPATTPTKQVLMEIVSASTLGNATVDPYCSVFINEQEVHRTKTIYNDPDPIWTVSTNSLCVLDIPLEGENMMKIEVNHGNQCLGVVGFNCSDLLNKSGAREEYDIQKSTVVKDEITEADDITVRKPSLALRFRTASPEDIQFFDLPCHFWKNDKASDIHFRQVNRKSVMSQYTKMNKNDNQKQFRVQPCPDPSDLENTKWMTREKLEEVAMEPSKSWVEVGYGDIGMIYVEVIGCNNLPNKDVGISYKSDPFVGIVFEDAMVRTDVIHDLLSPRWLPWTTRAFAFRVCHPSSILMVGVFDYDEAPIKNHDPIGRVVINTVNFKSNTTYNLHYTLHDDPQQRDDRGTIQLRLRVEWKNEAQALRASFSTPPRFLINVETQKSLALIRYSCRGRLNTETASIDAVKLHANELMSYGSVFCYVIDVCLNIWLWRGRFDLSIPFLGTKVNVWFPIHSIVLLIGAVLCIEMPTKIPAILLYSIAWILMSINFHVSKHPNPWIRCRSCNETNMIAFTGKSWHAPIVVHENDGVDDAAALEALDKVKSERVESFFIDILKVGLKVRKIYKKTQIESIAIETEDKNWSLMGNHLYYLHLILRMACTYLRMGRNFVNWRGYYTHKFTMTCVIGGTIWIVLPVNYVLFWVLRVLVWACFGPWMKLVDILYVHPHYRTKEELLVDPLLHGTNIDRVLTSESLQKMGASARLTGEEALKLKDMREHLFGKLSQLIPAVDTSRFPATPLSQSTAEPYLGCNYDLSQRGFVDVPIEAQNWRYIPGQQLGGNMVHHQMNQTTLSASLASKEESTATIDPHER